MAINFPNSPSNGDIFGNFTYDTSIPGWRKTPENSASLPAGTIVQWPGATAPANWLIADGSAVSRTTYASLFAAIGVQYGSGDGSTTFNLPNLKGRVAVGLDSSQTEFNTLGEVGGAKTHTLTVSEMPSHTHASTLTNATVASSSHNHGLAAGYALIGAGTSLVGREKTVPSWTFNKVHGSSGAGSGNYTLATELAGTTDSPSATTTVGITNASVGSDGAHNNLQPYIVLNYIIKTSAGVTSGDSELATRVGVVETSVRSVPLGGTGVSTLTSGAYLKGAGTSAVTTQVGIPKADLPAGTILQVATWRETSPFTSTATAFTSLLAVSITPRSTSSQMYIVCTLNGSFTGADAARRNLLSLFRDSTNISNPNAAGSRSPSFGGFFTQTSANGSAYQTVTISALDSPGTTSSVSYSIRTRMESGDTLYINRNVGDSDSALFPRGVSTITVFEVQG